MIVTFILDENPRLRSKHKLVLLGVATFGFICGLPFTFNGGVHLFTLLDARYNKHDDLTSMTAKK